MNLHKLTKIAAIVVAILSVIILGGLVAYDGEAADNTWITPIIFVSYIMLFVTIAIVLLFVFKNLFSNPASLKRTLMSLGIFAAILLISFVLANGDEVTANKEVVSGSVSRWVGTGLNMFYALAIIALGAMGWTALSKIRK
jgi:hypothetical protein